MSLVRTISTSHIRHKEQLFEENFELIFKSYFKDEVIKVETVDEDPIGVELDPDPGFHTHISKVQIKLSAFENPIRVTIKRPILGKLISRKNVKSDLKCNSK